jgi:hypothetical protein
MCAAPIMELKRLLEDVIGRSGAAQPRFARLHEVD